MDRRRWAALQYGQYGARPAWGQVRTCLSKINAGSYILEADRDRCSFAMA